MKVALLGTGDEIINGDILNTNAQFIAQELINNNMQPGNHMVAADDDSDLQASMRYLLNKHQALITIGGLGPTSDDLTRFALAKVVDQALTFDQSSWDMIESRLNKFNLPIPESNRQQCLFPHNAAIFTNSYGTANGCSVEVDNKVIYMLPGPPNECLPMFKQYVLPNLIERHFPNQHLRRSWLLLGVSEGSVAEKLEAIVANFEVDIGYRVDYPYLEIKCVSDDEKQLLEVSHRIEQAVGDKVVSTQRQLASNSLSKWITHHNVSIHIDDAVTGGLLETRIHSPETAGHLYFNDEPIDHIGLQVVIRGMRSYWQSNDKVKSDKIYLTINHDGDITETAITIPYRGRRMRAMACESICWNLLQQFKRIFDDAKSTVSC